MSLRSFILMTHSSSLLWISSKGIWITCDLESIKSRWRNKGVWYGLSIINWQYFGMSSLLAHCHMGSIKAIDIHAWRLIIGIEGPGEVTAGLKIWEGDRKRQPRQKQKEQSQSPYRRLRFKEYEWRWKDVFLCGSPSCSGKLKDYSKLVSKPELHHCFPSFR
jgi:hypothetical protein